MSKKEEPSYYAIVPAKVRYCKKLTPNAKLLYGEITCLCNKQGFCWATNTYFAKLYSKDRATISTWIQSLEENRFIRRTIKNNNRRRIYIVEGVLEKSNRGIRKTRRGVLEKSNTIYSNTRKNNNKEKHKLLSAKDRKSLYSTDKSSFDKKMSIKLEHLLREKKKFNSMTKPNSWPAQFLKFRQKNEITKKRFSLVMNFYCKHFGDKYIPKAYYANMFCDKFIQIEEARERLIKEIAEGKPRTVKRKKVGSKTIYGDGPMPYDDFVD